MSSCSALRYARMAKKMVSLWNDGSLSARNFFAGTVASLMLGRKNFRPLLGVLEQAIRCMWRQISSPLAPKVRLRLLAIRSRTISAT